jgi:hypothetical protein
MAKKIVRLTESDLVRLVKRVVKEQSMDMESPKKLKGYIGHKDNWFDEDDRPVHPDEIDYDEEIEFGPDDFDEYISHTDKHFPKNKWSFGAKGFMKGDRAPGKGYYDRYQKSGPVKVRMKKY